MYSFKNDYSEGCHMDILTALTLSNLEQQLGYGEDIYSIEAKDIIRQKIGNPNSAVHFVSGGTQANLIVISALLKSHESVICANTGHIYVHEAGAIEATGHKINTILSQDGKLHIPHIQSILDEHTDLHMVKPKMVYISNSTEIGTVYTKQELQELSAFCKAKDLYFFMDGARLGSALSSKSNDMTLNDIAELTDVFYIGGTKNGALLGEAIIINNTSLQQDFAFHIKQRGALLAKGRLLGIQFLTLFKNDLFFTLALHANRMATKIADAVYKKGYVFLTEPVSNQIFPILPNEFIQVLSKKYDFYVRQKVNNTHSAIRLVTSRATDEHIVDMLISEL